MNDIIVDNNLDLSVTSLGDFQVNESTSQEVSAIIMSFQGWWKEFLLIGCGAPLYIASPGNCEALRRQIQIQLASDGKKLSSFSYSFNTQNELIIQVNGLTINVNQVSNG